MATAREAVSGRGVVASNPPASAEVGAEVLRAGGNAVDAAVAASMACCMLQPQSTGIGGYACCGLVLDGRTGRVWSIDANAVAPAAAHERLYELVPPGAKQDVNEWEYGCSVRDNANIYGPLAVAVPGMMAGMGVAWERWGRLKWADIVAPSQKLLADGFPYATTAGAVANKEKQIRRFPASVEHLMPQGRLPRADEVWHRPHMDRTLARLAAAGWRDFYAGELGRTIADSVSGAGGILTRRDMSGYAPRVTEPYAIRLGDAEVFGAVLPNGSLTGLQIMLMMDALGMPAEDSAEYWHRLAEILKLAWRDRLRYVADPDFAPVPIERLLDPGYAAGRVESIRQFPRHVDRLDPEREPSPVHGTLHVSAADAEGNIAALTITQGMSFGSCFTVPGTGIILGHGMCRLDPRPGRANSVAAGKRPLNNMCPLAARTADRVIGIGLPGGRIIVSAMPRALHGMLRRGWTAAQAAAAPRLHLEGWEPVRMTKDVDGSTVEALRGMGHDIQLADSLAGCMNGVEVLTKDGTTRAGSGISAAGA